MNKYTFSSWFPDYIPKEVKKYKLLKDIPWCKAWTIFEVRKNYIEFWNWSFYEKDLTPDWFEEIKEIKKYRFKKDFFDLFEKWDVIWDNWRYYSDEWYNEYNSIIELIFNISKQEILNEYLEEIN